MQTFSGELPETFRVQNVNADTGKIDDSHWCADCENSGLVQLDTESASGPEYESPYAPCPVCQLGYARGGKEFWVGWAGKATWNGGCTLVDRKCRKCGEKYRGAYSLHHCARLPVVRRDEFQRRVGVLGRSVEAAASVPGRRGYASLEDVR